jgi:uncharacterized protein (TIGR03435 family)
MTLDGLLAHPAAQGLGRALIHFLWQGSLLAFLLWIVKTIAQPSAVRVRYAAAGLIMAMMPVTLVVTAVQSTTSEPMDLGFKVYSIAQKPTATEQHKVVTAFSDREPSAGISGLVVCIWTTGVLLFSLRAAGGWSRMHRLQRGAQPASTGLERMMRRLTLTLSVSAPVRLCTCIAVQVPTVIGWIRPLILLPVTTITGLSESQIEAILAHELAHIRRHDYLVNLLQTAIETVLFYHPAVWWVGKQMRVEREHCCDDIAVRVCGSAAEYARALVRLEEIRCRIPEPGLAANGGELLERIRRLLSERPSQASAARFLGATAAAGLALLIAVTPAIVSLHAAPQAQPTFEVASIKRNLSGEASSSFRPSPARFEALNQTLRRLLIHAYSLKESQLLGGPAWVDSDRYDIEAKADGTASSSRMMVMLQTILTDRFKLALHRETKEGPIYALTVAKGGLKLQPLKEGSCIPFDPDNPAPVTGRKPSDSCGYLGYGRDMLEATGITMADLAVAFSHLTGQTVVDKTGITGRFPVHLTFVLDDKTPQVPAAAPGDAGSPLPSVDAGPSIFAAVQEQLGLKLEPGKGPVEVLVIDHAEKPSEN